MSKDIIRSRLKIINDLLKNHRPEGRWFLSSLAIAINIILIPSYIYEKKHPEIHHYLWKGALWCLSYFAGSYVCISLNILTKYIE